MCCFSLKMMKPKNLLGLTACCGTFYLSAKKGGRVHIFESAMCELSRDVRDGIANEPAPLWVGTRACAPRLATTNRRCFIRSERSDGRERSEPWTKRLKVSFLYAFQSISYVNYLSGYWLVFEPDYGHSKQFSGPLRGQVRPAILPAAWGDGRRTMSIIALFLHFWSSAPRPTGTINVLIR